MRPTSRAWRRRSLRIPGSCSSGRSPIHPPTAPIPHASAVAGYLAAHRRVRSVYYPGLRSHPQHELAKQLFRGFGGILSFELDPAMDCFDFLNRLAIVVSSSNLGDNRTLAIPVAHTIF